MKKSGMRPRKKRTVDKVFTLLLSNFGENRSNAQLKRELYERRQRNRESVREFSRALLEISEGISDKLQSKNEMVIEVFCENLVDIHIKREMKRLVRGQSTISSSALRSEAIRLEEDGMGSSHENACVRGIQEPHHTPDEPSPLDRIAAQLELLATTQSEIVSLLRLQQQAPVGVVNPDKPEPRSGGAVCCEYCSRRVTPSRGAGSALVTGGVMGNDQQIANTGVIRKVAQRLMQCSVAR